MPPLDFQNSRHCTKVLPSVLPSKGILFSSETVIQSFNNYFTTTHNKLPDSFSIILRIFHYLHSLLCHSPPVSTLGNNFYFWLQTTETYSGLLKQNRVFWKMTVLIIYCCTLGYPKLSNWKQQAILSHSFCGSGHQLDLAGWCWLGGLSGALTRSTQGCRHSIAWQEEGLFPCSFTWVLTDLRSLSLSTIYKVSRIVVFFHIIVSNGYYN